MKLTIKRLKKLIKEAMTTPEPGKPMSFMELKSFFPEIARVTAENAVNGDPDEYPTAEAYEQASPDSFVIVRKDDPEFDFFAADAAQQVEGLGPEYMLMMSEGDTGGSNVSLVWADDGWIG